ncbi:asparaginase [Roseomonas sp. SSH11]|uniref:Asparaginase n=1 Tax=Pararoseomonas baculiformis TaxID=2820812 RepID=A0ABS4AI31_9PROT|nr:asparaginase [Pararoseomonas baculiformis]MBP0446539.1 asparaginase [Pararoseomonas baculiformis]
MTSPIPMVEIRRGGVAESIHHGIAVVADADGRLLHAWGDPDFLTFPRSSLKPFQALSLVESGAADGLDAAHLALACASHRAEPFQVSMVENWLRRLGRPESALVCGPALPMGEGDLADAVRAGGKRRVFHNCSGKHCGFLAAAQAFGTPSGYDSPDHPAQRHWLAALSELIGHDATALPQGTDGCGLPALAMTMADTARAAARYAALGVADPKREAAIRRLLAALREHPDHVSGHNRPTSRIVAATDGRVVLKEGAEGFVLGFVPERGLGIAVKMLDGASRGKMAVFATLLGRLGILPEIRAAELARAVEAPVLDSNNRVVGEVAALALG